MPRLIALSAVGLFLVWFTSNVRRALNEFVRTKDRLRDEILGHQRTAQALRESRHTFLQLSTVAPIGIFKATAEGRLLFINTRCAELVGTAVTDAIGSLWTDGLHPDDRERVTAAWRDAIDARAEFHIECRFQDARSGRIRWGAAAATSVDIEQDRLPCLVGTIMDITPLKEAEDAVRRLVAEGREREEQLRLKQDQLIQAGKLATIGEMATCITHDINNPLNNISLFVGNLEDAIKSGDVDQPQMLEALRFVQQQVRRAAEIISHLHMFARRSDPRRDLCSIHDVIQTALSFVREPLALAAIDVAVDFASGEPIVKGNAVQLEQVFVNLLLNARDAMAGVDHRAIRMRTAVLGTEVQVVIDDTGPGVPPHLTSRVFEPFFTTKQAGSGTGLGLSISSTIIAAHQGTIEVGEAPGGGARFTLQLPLAQA